MSAARSAAAGDPVDEVVLHPLDEAVAREIASGGCPAGWRCAADFPAEGDRVAAGMFLERTAAGVDTRPFGGFVVGLRAPGAAPCLAIGGIGFHGGPGPRGQVEIGYGIVASHQRQGYATEALRLLIAHARVNGAVLLMAETEFDNPARSASEAVLRRHGFTKTGADDRVVRFERSLRSP